MNSDIVHAVINLSLTLISYYGWKTSGDRRGLWWAQLGAVATFANLVHYSIKNIFQAPLEIQLISSKFFLIFEPIVIVLVLLILFKGASKNKK